MAKSRTFSAYLLKADIENPVDALRDDHPLQTSAASKLPKGASLYILDSKPRPPWWRDYFGITTKLMQEQKGALVFLPVKDRIFALSFGQVHHNLRDNAYEYDFGLRVTLNSVDPKELKSADMVSPGAARRKRTQVPTSTDLTYLDFDGNSEIIKSLTGKVKAEYRNLFRNATGAVALKVTLKIEPDELMARCEKLLDLYSKEDFKTTFPNIQNILPIKDPTKTKALDAALVHAVQQQSDHLNLAIPDIVDFRDSTCCMFYHDGDWSEVFPEISIENFYQFLGGDFDLNNISLDFLRQCRVSLCDADGEETESHSLYRSLLFDVEDTAEKVVYHLCDGEWYKAQADFVLRLKTYLDPKCADTTLLAYDHDATIDGKTVYSERQYNEAVPAWDNKYILLDRTDISPSNNTEVEPCDLYVVEDDETSTSKLRGVLYHVKISTRSTYLSHLFNQGLNSMELIKGQPECREKMKTLVTDGLKGNDAERYLSPLSSFDLRVVYAIVTHKDKANKSENLPLFSKISLMRNMMRLDIMSIPSSLTFIEDKSPTKHGHSKHPQILARIGVNPANGKKELRPVAGHGYDPKLVIKGAPKDLVDSAPGDQFLVTVRVNDDDTLSTHHTWPYKAVT